MQPAATTINRDASAQAKGPRLQRLRACGLLIDALANEDAIQVYSCVEAVGDVYNSTADASGTSTYSEEDKNYDGLTKFTLLSTEILNSLVIFTDMWIDARYSARLRFGFFYTPASIGKEQANGERIKRLGLPVPAEPCLQLLSAAGPYSQAVVDLVKALVIDEYAEQYAKRPRQGFLDDIRKWGDDSWQTLLARIVWQFGASDHQAVTAETLTKIRSCKEAARRRQNDAIDYLIKHALNPPWFTEYEVRAQNSLGNHLVGEATECAVSLWLVKQCVKHS